MKSNRITALALMCIGALFLLPVQPVHGGEQTGKINGNVYDPDGRPLSGVTITITSENLMGKRQVQTAEDGSFLAFGLPPGKYSIEIEQTGFMPFKQENVRVQIGGTATLDILMELPTAEETVVVTAKRPVVDKESTTMGQNFDDEFLEEVPVTRQYQSVAALAPGVVSGGDNIHGGSAYSNQYLIDGVNTTDPVTNTFSANINYDAIKEFQVLTGGLDAEYGQATGGIINLVTKSGGNEFHVDTTFYMTPNWLNLKDDFEKEEAGRNDEYQFNVNVGGPVFKDKLWYFVSVEIDRLINSISATEDFFNPTNPDKIQHPERKWFSLFYFGKLTYQLSDNHKLTFMTQGDPSWLENELQAVLVAPEAEVQRFQGGGFYSLAWEATWTKNLFQKTQLAYKNSRLQIYPMSDCTDIDNPDCRGHYDTSTGISSVNATSDVDLRRNRLQFDSSWTYYWDNLLGDHEFKAGWQYFHSWEDGYESLPGGGYYLDQEGRPYKSTMLKEVNGQLRPLETTVTGDTLGVFLQDSWKITKNLILKPGVRFDWAQMLNYKGDTITKFLTTSPRFNLVWDILGDGKTVFRAGYNRYTDTGYLLLSGFVGKSLETSTCDYNALTGKYDSNCRTDGGDDGVVVKDNLTTPHTDEVTLQLERELFTDFSLSVNAIWRETKFIYEDDEANLIWNQQGTDVIGFKNGEDGVVWNLGTPKEAWRRYWAFEIVAEKAFSDNWQMAGSYTYSRAEGAPDSLVSAYLDNPRQNKYYWSWLDFDRRHVIKVQGGYHLPYGLEVGATVFWATGYPYSKVVKNDYTGGYSNFIDRRGYDPDHPDDPYWNRYPDIFRLDLKLVWDLKELTDQQIDVIFEMINVMHLRDKSLLETRDTPPGSPTQYGQFYGHAIGFQGAMGLRYRY